MLSPFFPQWLIPFLSSGFNVVFGKLPGQWKGSVLLLVALAVTAGVVAATPLEWDALSPQAIILYGILTAGYTLTAPIEGASRVAVIQVLALIAIPTVLLAGFGRAYAQDAAPPVQATASVMMQIGLGFLNGVLGRLVKRIKF